MKMHLLAASALFALGLAACGDDSRMAGDDPLRDTQEARRGDAPYPSLSTNETATPTPAPGAPGTTPPVEPTEIDPTSPTQPAPGSPPPVLPPTPPT